MFKTNSNKNVAEYLLQVYNTFICKNSCRNCGKHAFLVFVKVTFQVSREAFFKRVWRQLGVLDYMLQRSAIQ